MPELDVPDFQNPQTQAPPPRFDQFVADKSASTQGVKSSNTWGAKRTGHIHQGQDFGGAMNSNVGAADDGEIIFAGPNGNMGNAVKIKHPDGTVSVYGHLNKIGVKQGDQVTAGSSIGLLGQTGNAKGPHVHFELYQNGLPIDPAGTKYRPQIGSQTPAAPRFDEFAQQAAAPETAPPRFDEFVKQQPLSTVTAGTQPKEKVSVEAKPIEFQGATPQEPIEKPSSTAAPIQGVAPVQFQQGTGLRAPTGVADYLATKSETQQPRNAAQEPGAGIRLPFSPDITPTQDDVERAVIHSFGSQYDALNEQYRKDSKEKYGQAENMVKLPREAWGSLKRESDGSVIVGASQGAVDYANAYAKNGLAGVEALQKPGAHAFEARNPSTMDKISEAGSSLLQSLNIDTPGGLKSDVPRGVAHAVTLGAIGEPREITPEEKLLNPQAEATANLGRGVGEVAGSLLPFVAAGKILAPLELAKPVQTAAQFGLVDAGKQVVNTVKGRNVDWSSPVVSAGLGTVIGHLEGADPSIVRKVIAFVAPQLALDAAQGVPREQAIKNAITNMGFALGTGNERSEPDVRTQEQQAETLPISRAQAVPDFERTLADREAVVKPVTDAQGNVLLNPDEVAQGGKPKIKLANQPTDEPAHLANFREREKDGTFAEGAAKIPEEFKPENVSAMQPAQTDVIQPSEAATIPPSVLPQREAAQPVSTETTASIPVAVKEGEGEPPSEEPPSFNWHTRQRDGQWAIVKPDGTEISRVTDRSTAEQIVNEMRNQPDASQGMSLSQAVRAAGGIRVDKDLGNQGEVSRLSNKETQSSGLVNNKSGSSLESMAEAMANEGYGIGDWAEQGARLGSEGKYKARYEVNMSRFLEAVEEDQSGNRKHYSTADQSDLNNEELRYLQEQQDSHDLDQTDSLLSNERTGELYDKIASGQASETEVNEFKRSANELGISPEYTDKLISSAHETSTGAASETFESPKEPDTTEAAKPTIAEPEFVKRARDYVARHESHVGEGGEYRGSGGPDTQLLINKLIVEGYEFYAKSRPKFEEWAREMRRRFGAAAEEHLRGVYAMLRGQPSEESTTAAYKAKVDEERVARGAEELPWSPKTKSDEELLASAKDANERKPNEAQQLTQEVLKKPRALSDQETVQIDLHKQALVNDHNQLLREIVNTTDPEKLAAQSARLDAIEQEWDDTDRAWRLSGTEKGRSLRSQRITINQNYELLPMKARMKAATGEAKLPPEVEAKIEAQQKRIAELEARWTKRVIARDKKAQADKLDTFIVEKKIEIRRAGRRRAHDDLVKERADIKQQVAQAWAKMKPKTTTLSMGGLGDLDPNGELTRALGDLARNYIEDGVIKATDLVDTIHEQIKDVADLTKRQVSDLLSGYGKIKESTIDPVEKKFNEIKSILASTSGTADVLEKGVRPSRRGQQREKPTEDQRRALRELEDAMREKGPELARQPYDVKTEQATPLDKAKTTARNRQEQLQKWIADGKREVQGRQQVIPDAELNRLKAENAALEKVVALLDDPAADQKAIERRMGELNKAITEGKRKIATGEVASTLKEGAHAVWSPEVGQLERERIAVNKELTALRAEKARQSRAEAAAKPEAQAKAHEEALEKRLAAIEEQIDNLKNPKPKEVKDGAKSVWSPEVSDAERRLAETRRTTALGKSIAETQGRISGQRSTIKEGAQSVWTPEIGAMEKERRALMGIANDMRADAARKAKAAEATKPIGVYGVEGSWADFEARAKKALAARTRFEKQIADMQQRRAAGDFEKKPKVKPLIHDPDTERLRLELNREKRKFDADVFNAKIKKEWNERPWWSKGMAYGAAGVRAGVLSGVKTLGKIGSALAQRTGQQYAEEGASRLAKPFVRGTAEKATRYGGHMNVESEKAFARGFGAGVKEIPNVIRTGESELSRRFSDRHPGIPSKLGRALEVPGRFHFSEKNPLMRGEFERYKELALQEAERKSPGARNDPAVIDEIEERAYKSAKEVILMGDNPFSRVITDAQRRLSLEQRDVVRTIVPVHRVAGNYLNQAINEYGLGIFRGAIRAIHERNPDALAKLTPEEADKTMRLIQRGTLGVVYMALAGTGIGGAAGVKFGGFYKRGRKDEVQPQDIKVGKVTIPHWALHSPPDELAQLTASMKQEWDEGKQREETRGQRFASGAARSMKGVLSQTPFVNELTQVTNSLDSGDNLAGWAGRFVASRVEPQIVQEIAKATDKYQGQDVKRKPRGFTDALKMGLPGARQTVPISSVFGSKPSNASSEVRRLDMTLGGVARQPDEPQKDFAQRQAFVNPYIRRALEQVVSDPEYQKDSDPNKIERLKQAKESAQKEGQAAWDDEHEKPEKDEKPEYPRPSGAPQSRLRSPWLPPRNPFKVGSEAFKA